MSRLNRRILLFNDDDLSGDVHSAAKDVQTVYIQAVTGTLSVNKPTAWVAAIDESVSGTPPNASSGQIPHWTKKRPTYQTNYPVIFVAEQKRAVDGTITCTTPVKDDSVTIIDGGHITTGTIDSNRLNADTIKVRAANIVGTLIIGQLPEDVAQTGDIPTKVSDLTNDSNFQTNAQVSNTVTNATKYKADKSEIPTNVSELTNDSGFQTSSQVSDAITTGISGKADKDELPTKVSDLTNDSNFQTGTQVESAITSKDYATNTSLTNEINARKAVYGTSSTASGTQVKAVTCSNFTLYTGASITVTFTNANTHSTPTLNVNSTGSKTIKGYSGASLTAAEYKWVAGATLTFVYDGSYWRMQDSGATESKAAAASSASAAATSANTASTKASEASTSASNAASSASTANTKASEAASSASTASSKASEASASASTASSKATAASNSASAASQSASEASGSATTATNQANAAKEAVDWTVGIIVTAINYSANTATLQATVYKGGVVQTTGYTLQWYKNSTKITSGGTSATLSVTDLNASYTCIAS